MNSLNFFEIGILDWIAENCRCEFLDAVLPVITKFADKGIGWIILALVLICFKKTRKAGFMMGAALVFGLVIGNGILKNVIARIRPYDVNPFAVVLVPRLTDYSFPSGHTLASFEAAGVLMMTHRKTLGYPALVLAIIIALSRLYIYVHYPTDVLAGIVLGLLFAYLGYLLVNFIYKKLDERKSLKTN